MRHRGFRTALKALLSALGLVLLLLSFAWLNRSSILSSEAVRSAIDAAGPLGPLGLGVVYSATVIVSPLAGSPLIVTAAAAYGYWGAVLTTFLGNLIGSSVNFGIARLAGRPAVRWFVGRERMTKLDEIAEMTGVRTLIALRLLGGGLFDFVSYAAGLTPMRFTSYFAITNLYSLPSLLVLVYLFDRAIRMPTISAGLMAILIVGITVGAPWLIYRRERRVFLGRRAAVARGAGSRSGV